MNQPSSASSAGRFFAAVGSACLLGPLAAFAFTAYTIVRQLGAAPQTGVSLSPDTMHQAVHSVFTATCIGLGFGLLGVVLVYIAIFGFRFAASWLRSALIVGAVGLLPAMPVGTVFAFVLFRVQRRHSQMLSQLPAA